MTVTYTAEVATCRGFGCFLKLLARWRGSIYKLVWLDLTVFLFIYYVLNIIYRIGLNDHQKAIFESIVRYCSAYSNLIPISFVLGFYVSIVMTRWWNQYICIPWPDSIAVFVSANIHGQDERGRVMRRTIMRYVCLCLTMVLTNISPKVKKRFPTLEHLVDAGLLVDNERQIMESLNLKFPRYSKHWMPIVWAASIITRARKEGRIRDDFAVKTIIDELNKFRGQSGLLTSYDMISVPLVYTQVVTLAVYSYFLTAVVGQQWVKNKETVDGFFNNIDLYFPIFTTLQFFFYMGWLKVAESLINPFGEDDDDFEVNWMIDRNLQVSYMIVDEMHHEHPQLIRDQYWDEIFPSELPYTVAAEQFREEHPAPSTANIELPKSSFLPAPSSVKINEMVGKSAQSVNYKFPENENDFEFDDDASGIHFTAYKRPTSRVPSNTSIHSLAGSMHRVNTYTSALKRFFSKEDRDKSGGQSDRSGGDLGSSTQKLPGSSNTGSQQMPKSPNTPGPTNSTSIPNNIGGGSTNKPLTNQTIEEVDEQQTITSMREQNEIRPTAQSIFANPPIVINPAMQSIPIDVPGGRTYERTHSAIGPMNPTSYNYQLPELSSSVPVDFHQDRNIPFVEDIELTAGIFSVDDLPTVKRPEEIDGNVCLDESTDEFEKLRQAREKERQERTKIKLVKSISTHNNIPETETLIEIAATSCELTDNAQNPNSIIPGDQLDQIIENLISKLWK